MASTRLQSWLVQADRGQTLLLGLISWVLFTIGKHQVKCVPEHAKAYRAKLKVASSVEVPPQTKVIVNCKATQIIKNFGNPYAVAQPANSSW